MIKTLTPLVFMLSMLTAHSQNLDWYLNFGGLGYDPMHATDLDEFGNVYISSSFASSVDLDPGPDNVAVSSVGARSLVVAKYSPEGELLWYQMVGNPALESIDAFDIVYRNQSLWVTGNFVGEVSFDPENPTNIYTSSGYGDVFILKLNSEGQFMNMVNFASAAYGGMSEIKVDEVGQVYACGNLLSAVDFDPSVNEYVMTPQSSWDCFLLKLNQDLSFQWAKQFTSSLGLYTIQMDLDSDGQVFCGGTYFGQADFNAGNPDGIVGESEFVNEFGQNFLVKIMSNGDFGWIKTFGGDDTDFISDLVVDSSNQLYILGSFHSSGDYDPGDGVYIIDGADVSVVSRMFILHTDNDGNLTWIKLHGDGIDSMSPSVCSLTEDRLLIGGYRSSVNFVMLADLSGEELHSLELQASVYGVHGFQNKLFVNGAFSGTMDVDPGANVVLLTNPDNASNGLLIGYDLISEQTLDLTLCYGDSIFINDTWLYEIGYYTDTLTNQYGLDSIVHYQVTTPYFPLPPTYADLCEGASDDIYTDIVGETYLWSTGEETPSINISNTGLYTCTISGFGCTYIDSVYVNSIENPVVEMGYWSDLDTTGVHVIISGGSGPYDVIWDSPIDAWTDSIAFGGEGNYHATVTDVNGCVDEIGEYIISLTTEEYFDVSLCFGDSVFVLGAWRYETGEYEAVLTNQYGLDSIIHYNVYTPYYPTVPGNFYTCGGPGSGLIPSFMGDSYLWSNGDETQVTTITGEGLYVCTVTGFGCSVIDSTYVHFWESPTASVEYWSDCNAFGVQAVITGGTPPYSLNWDYPYFATTDSIEYVGAGLYHATISDSNGCLAEASNTIVDPIVSCPGDLDGNQVIGVADLIILMGEYGNTDAFCDPYDLNEDGLVDINDILEIIVMMGGICNN
ncbi:MAG: hypothetical protein IPP69_18050 [Flavobacteriales bacterium]|nr:hypothetical protein [Flavobacteriales bacterium]